MGFLLEKLFLKRIRAERGEVGQKGYDGFEQGVPYTRNCTVAGKNPKNQRSDKLSIARAFLLVYIYTYNHLQSI